MNRSLGVKIVAGIFVVLTVIPVMVFVFPQVIGATQSYVVLSSSMSPAIEPGDVILVDNTSPEEIRKGDIITFHEPAGENETTRTDDTTTHRVSKVITRNGTRYFRTRGDANDRPDNVLIPAENVIGEVERTIPYLGYVSMFMGSPRGFLLLVGIPVVLLILSEVYTILIELRK